MDLWHIPAAFVGRAGVRIRRLADRLQSPRASLFAKGREQAVPLDGEVGRGAAEEGEVSVTLRPLAGWLGMLAEVGSIG